MKNINARALSQATSWTIILVTVLTIWGEMHKVFKTFLVSLSGHHWVTKGIISLVFFILLYVALQKKNKNSAESESSEMAVVWVTVISGIIIFLFFVWHFLSA